MIEYLIIHNSFVIDVNTEDISDIKFQLRHLHLEENIIQQKRDQNARHLMFVLICLYFSWYIYIGAGKISNIQC